MKEQSEIHFVKVGNGRLALFHRPSRHLFPHLKALGCTHVVTLLKETEGAQRMGELTKSAGMEWVWIPVRNGNHPEGEVHERLMQALPQLSQLLDEGNSLLIHCSAGVHRTGTVAYGLLRWRGMNRELALGIIGQTRMETAEGMMTKRMRWGDENARALQSQNFSWLNSVQSWIGNLFSKRNNIASEE